ncbi:MAG: LIC_13387 family protein [Flavisolibacter sp.]
MKPKLLLRIAAVLILFHAIGHTIGHSGWKKDTDPVKKEVIRQMTGHEFSFMGKIRSLGDYYEGFGYACSIALLLITVILWFTAQASDREPILAKKIALTIGCSMLLWGGLELYYFFPFAAAFSLLASALAFWAGLQNLQKEKAVK